MPKGICTIEGCARDLLARGYCATHYARWRKHGDALHGGPVAITGRSTCSIEGCGKPHLARGYCGAHYAQWQRHGDPLGNPAPEGREERWLKQRDGFLRSRYGITQAEYDALATAQDGRCALCHETPKRRRETRLGEPWIGLVVDHDHNSGRVRGLLCMGCNIAMGRIDKVGVDAVVAYAQSPDVEIVPAVPPLAQRVDTI